MFTRLTIISFAAGTATPEIGRRARRGTFGAHAHTEYDPWHRLLDA